MEEYNLTFLEAIRGLDERKCKEIENGAGCKYKLKGSALTYVGLSNDKTAGITLTTRSFLGKWRLIDPKPVKRKKVIEDIKWNRYTGSTIIYPRGCFDGWHSLPGKPPMKMTLEWEE